VVERGPEKAGVGGSIPSLATTFQKTYPIPSQVPVRTQSAFERLAKSRYCSRMFSKGLAPIIFSLVRSQSALIRRVGENRN
jgi:hypothetical protein